MLKLEIERDVAIHALEIKQASLKNEVRNSDDLKRQIEAANDLIKEATMTLNATGARINVLTAQVEAQVNVSAASEKVCSWIRVLMIILQDLAEFLLALEEAQVADKATFQRSLEAIDGTETRLDGAVIAHVSHKEREEEGAGRLENKREADSVNDAIAEKVDDVDEGLVDQDTKVQLPLGMNDSCNVSVDIAVGATGLGGGQTLPLDDHANPESSPSASRPETADVRVVVDSSDEAEKVVEDAALSHMTDGLVQVDDKIAPAGHNVRFHISLLMFVGSRGDRNQWKPAYNIRVF